MSEEYWKDKAEKREEQDKFNDQLNGFLALVLVLVFFIVICLI